MHFRQLLIFLFLFSLGMQAANAAIDNLKWPAGQLPAGQTNGPDGLDDIWQSLYNAWGLDPNGDEDHDGCSNLIESIAGTNPFVAGDCFKIGNMVISGTNVIFTVKVEAGKKYRVLSSDGPSGPTWTAETMQAPISASFYIPTADSTSVNLVVAKAPGTRKFYKIETGDIDSDSDGVSDWAERKLGLNPFAAISDLVSGVPDGTVVATELATPDVVTITATTPFATEDAPTTPAQLTISRSRKLLPATINYTTTGTAIANTDYNISPSMTSLVLPAGTTSSTINVAPIPDALIEGGESVTVTLTSATNGTSTPPILGNPNKASVIINPSTAPTGTGLTAYYYDTASTTAADALNFGQPGTYVYTRDVSPTTTGTIAVTYNGTIPGLAVNTVVKLSFSSGNLNVAPYTHANYTVTGVSGQTFSARITGASALPTSGTGFCGLSIQSSQHPPTLTTRVDPTVNFDWQFGTPNGAVIAPNNSPDNYSSAWEGYLQPITAGDYTFQLDADDKARVLLDTGSGLVQIVEHNWTTPGSDPVGTFKQSAPITLAVPGSPTARYRMRVEHVETTGDARCRLQWKIAGGSFANIPQANQFTHTQAQTYSYSAGSIVVTPSGGHSFVVGNTAPLSFSSGPLFSPGIASTYNGNYTITSVNGTTSFTVPLSPVNLTLTGAVTTAGSNVVTVSSTAGLTIGMSVSGTGLPANEFITSVGATTFTVTTGTGVTAQPSTTLLAVNPSLPVTITGAATTAGSNSITVSSTTGLAIGMAISGAGLPAGEFITAIGAGTITVTTATGITTQVSTTLTGTFSVTTTATTLAGNATITVPSTAGLAVGMTVTGNGLPANELITAVGATTITVTTGTGITAQASTTLTAQFPSLPIFVTGASTIAGSTFVTAPNLSGLAVGMIVSGTGLPAGEVITSIGNGYFTVTTGTGVTAQASTALTAVFPPTTALTGSGFILNVPSSTTTGLYNLCYANMNFANSPGRVGIDAAVTTGNNGVWNSGTPDVNLIQPDSFSVHWAGQVQPQFTEEYTFTVQADDGCTLSINGQPQVLKVAPSALTGVTSYTYDASNGNVLVNYTGAIVLPGSFIPGETVRIDPTSSNLSHAPTTSPTYSYNGTTGNAVIDYSNLVVGSAGGTLLPGSFVVGDVVELDPTSGSASNLSNMTYTVTAVANNTFTVNFGTGVYATGTGNITINDTRNAVITSVHATGTGTYNYTTGTGVTVVDYSSLVASGIPANVVTVGQKIALDPTSGNISALNSSFYTVTAATATTFTVTVSPATAASGTGNMFIIFPASGAVANGITTAFMVNLASNGSGSGAGKYADNSTGTINVDFANKSFKDWSSNGNERYVRIPMVGGTRYDVQLDYYENTGASRCILSWYSPSLSKEVIPSNRLYPVTGTVAPPLHITDTEATGLIGGSFSQAISGSNGANVTLSGAPAWLNYSNGVLSGTPPAGTAGDYQILITLTNTAGTSKSLLTLHIADTGGTIAREYWNGVSGTTVSSIPTSTNPTGSTNLTSLSNSGSGTNYGERIRGYITAPTTGNYYFWLAASDGAELWISNDSEPVDIFKRASVTTGSTTPQTWNAETSQKSGWLALEQGQRYYIEIIHKAGSTSGDNIALGWSKPGEATTAPSEVVPGFVLSPYVAPAPNSSPGTLYVATMLSQSGAATTGVGSATLRISEDGNYGYMTRSYSGLTGPITNEHIHADPYLTNPSAIIYDIDAPATSGDGLITNPADSHYTGTNPLTATYKWTIQAVGTLTKADIQELIKQGKAYINLHTAAYPNGEIRGNFTFANGSRTFTAPPASPTWTDDSNTDAGAVRFLTQASFGANVADIAALKALTPSGAVPASGIPASRYDAWIEAQFLQSPTQHLPEVLAREIADVFGPFDVKVAFNTWWKTSMTAPDQLRQRVAFALSEIHVISGSGPLEDNSKAMADFYDTLTYNAFGNFRTVLTDTTLTPAMGRYLDMLGNDKQDITVGRSPNENYAREIKQLFSIGLYRMWPDGTLMLTSTDSPIDTYSQREIVGLAHVFTGWYYGYDGAYRTSFNAAQDWTRPMREVPSRHDTGSKRVLNNEVLPGLLSLGGQPLDANANHIFSQSNDPIYQALPSQELSKAHDILFNHPNVGPFICRQLIQRLVTSNPSRDYLYRVVQKFNNNGSGVRGDMKAVIKAILLDYEARSSVPIASPAYGKQREPLLRVAAAARAFRPSNTSGTYAQSGANTITITTSVPHLLQTGNSVFLEFTDATVAGAQPAPTTGTYTVTVTGANTYTIPAPGWMTGTYTQTGTTVTITMSGHYLSGNNTNVIPTGQVLPAANKSQAYFDFTSGGLDNLAGFDKTVQTVATSTSYDIPSGAGNSATAPSINGNASGTTFTITAPDSATRSGNVMISRFGGSYSCTGRNGIITIDTFYGGSGTWGTMADHGLIPGDTVFLNFTNSRDTTSFVETSTENDLVYTIASVPDANTFTVAARDAANAAMNSDNQVVVFPLKAQPLTRNGTINTRPSTYTLDNTDGDIGQTPINSPTVFNYFLPEFKYPGALASQGITTPEFQGTAETTVIRHSQFIYNGIFNPSNTTGLSSFKSGTNALVMDLSPWMGNAVNTAGTVGAVLGAGPQTGEVWTSNANLPTLVDRLNTLLLGGQLPSGAKTAILQFIGGKIQSIATGSPCVITMPSAHGLAVGDTVVITGVSGGTFTGATTTCNGTFLVNTVPSSTTLTLKSTTSVNQNCTNITGLILTNSTLGIVPYTNVGPTTTNVRDRLRAVLHFILTSPDYTIQR
jgi:uncharacterized protein (DUF1800 family)